MNGNGVLPALPTHCKIIRIPSPGFIDPKKQALENLNTLQDLEALIDADLFSDFELKLLCVLLQALQVDTQNPRLLQKLKGKSIYTHAQTLHEECIQAAKENQPRLLSELLKMGAKPYYADHHGRSALVYAFYNRIEETAKEILNNPGSAIDLNNLHKPYHFFYVDPGIFPREEKTDQSMYQMEFFPGSQRKSFLLIELACMQYSSALLALCIQAYQRISSDEGLKPEVIKVLKKICKQNLHQVKKTKNDFLPNPNKTAFDTSQDLANQLKEFESFLSGLKEFSEDKEEFSLSDLQNSQAKKPEDESLINYSLLADELAEMIDEEAQATNTEWTRSLAFIQKLQEQKQFMVFSEFAVDGRIALHRAIQYGSDELCRALLRMAPYSQLHYIEPYDQYQTKTSKSKARDFKTHLETDNTVIQDVLKIHRNQADFFDYHIYIIKRKAGLDNKRQASRVRHFQEICDHAQTILEGNDTHLETLITLLKNIIDSDKAISVLGFKLETENHASILRGISNQMEIYNVRIIIIENTKRLYGNYRSSNHQQKLMNLLRSKIYRIGNEIHLELQRNFPAPNPDTSTIDEVSDFLTEKNFFDRSGKPMLIDGIDYLSTKLFTAPMSDWIRNDKDLEKFKKILDQIIYLNYISENKAGAESKYDNIFEDAEYLVKRFPTDMPQGQYHLFSLYQSYSINEYPVYFRAFIRDFCESIVRTRDPNLMNALLQVESNPAFIIYCLRSLITAEDCQKNEGTNAARSIAIYFLNTAFEMYGFDFLLPVIEDTSNPQKKISALSESPSLSLNAQYLETLLAFAPYTQLNAFDIKKSIESLSHSPHPNKSEIIQVIDEKIHCADLIDYQLYIDTISHRNDKKSNHRRTYFNTLIDLFNASSNVLLSQSLNEKIIQTLKEGIQRTKSMTVFGIKTGSESHSQILSGILYAINKDPNQQAQIIQKLYGNYLHFMQNRQKLTVSNSLNHSMNLGK